MLFFHILRLEFIIFFVKKCRLEKQSFLIIPFPLQVTLYFNNFAFHLLRFIFFLIQEIFHLILSKLWSRLFIIEFKRGLNIRKIFVLSERLVFSILFFFGGSFELIFVVSNLIIYFLNAVIQIHKYFIFVLLIDIMHIIKRASWMKMPVEFATRVLFGLLVDVIVNVINQLWLNELLVCPLCFLFFSFHMFDIFFLACCVAIDHFVSFL